MSMKKFLISTNNLAIKKKFVALTPKDWYFDLFSYSIQQKKKGL